MINIYKNNHTINSDLNDYIILKFKSELKSSELVLKRDPNFTKKF